MNGFFINEKIWRYLTNFWTINKPPKIQKKTEAEKITPQPELEKKKSKEIEKSIDIIFGRIQSDIIKIFQDAVNETEKEVEIIFT